MISVTQVLDHYQEPELVDWKLSKGKVACEKISTEAKRVGSLVDEIIKAELQRREPPPFDPKDIEVVNCLQAWQRHKERHPDFVLTVTGIQTELIVDDLVGHPDLEITEPTRWGIVDIKTSKAIQPKHWTQTGKYRRMREQLTPNPLPSFIGILRLDKQTAQPEYRIIDDPTILEYEAAVFDHYLATYQHSQRLREILRQLREAEVLDVA